MRIGILALEGSYEYHRRQLDHLGVVATLIHKPADLADVDGVILPGGHSPTMGERLRAAGLHQPLLNFAATDRPIWGTCAGLVLLARAVGREQPLLGLIDMTVQRAAFGQARECFEEMVHVPVLGPSPFPALFLRAPIVESVEPGVRVLAGLADGRIVAVQQRRLLATAFHPERTTDLRFHQYFLHLSQRSAAEGGRR